MNDPKLQDLMYSDPIEEIIEQKGFDDEYDYDDQSFGALLESSNDF